MAVVNSQEAKTHLSRLLARVERRRVTARRTAVVAVLIGALAAPAAAQTITVVGTPHLARLAVPPSAEQLAHTIEALAAFRPTQVCVERMSGERIEGLAADPVRNGPTLEGSMHNRPLVARIVPVGMALQIRLERRAADAREEARELLARWDELPTPERIRLVGLQLAGFELHSAALNWSHLEPAARAEAGKTLPAEAVAALDAALESPHEVYSLAVPLARKRGLHDLCTADAPEDETRGMEAAMAHGGLAMLEDPRIQARLSELLERSAAAWRPESGPEALTAALRFFNGDEYAQLDRRLQWETLAELDDEAGAFQRRLMYWHARTSEMSAELYRALARGPEERVLFIVGSAHRPFTEASLRAQPWVEVVPSAALLRED